MKLPADTIINPAKLTHYLLVERKRDDKARWLASLGYTLDNWDVLEKDLRQLLHRYAAELIENNAFGMMYEIVANLVGPNGRQAAVRSIWMIEHATGYAKFITLYPHK